MSQQGLNRADKNKAVRQQALREQLSAQGHVQHVIDIAEKLQCLTNELESNAVQRLKAAADIRLKLINKYLPDLKAVDMTVGSDPDKPVMGRWEVVFVGADHAADEGK